MALTGFLLSGVVACGEGEGPPVQRDPDPPLSADVPPLPPGDGLLGRPELQALVDLQQRRDGPALMVQLSDPDPLVRGRAARALASVQDPASIPALLQVLRDPEVEVQRAAAFALARVGGEGIGATLLTALEGSTDAGVRHRLMEGIGSTGERAELEALAGVDVSASGSELWLLSLGRFANRGVVSPRALEVIADGLRLPEPGLRWAAAYPLSRHTDPEVWASLAGAARDVLGSMRPWEVAAQPLLTGFARRANPADAPALLRWGRDPVDWRTRVNGVQAMAAAGASEVRPVLLDALDDPSEHVAIAAAEGLAALTATDEPTLAAVQERLADPTLPWRVTGPLLRALIRGGAGDVVLAWHDALPSAEEDRRAASLAALAILPDPGALDRLIDAVGDPSPMVARAAVRALGARAGGEAPVGEARDRAIQALLEAADRDDAPLRSGALRALASPAFRSEETAATLADRWDSLDPQRDATTLSAVLEALAELDHPDLVPFLHEAAWAPSAALRAKAAELLETRGGLPEGPDPLSADQLRPPVDWALLAGLGPRPRLVLDTGRGRIVANLSPEEAPLTVGALAQLANAGRYDGTPFHRVVANFVVQGGDVARGDGSGGPGYRLRTELTRIPFQRGTLGMASSGKDTEGSQFFITHSPQPHLDVGYTAFGWVVEGMDVVDLLQVGDVLLSARVEPDGS